jgi:hypothetical protein
MDETYDGEDTALGSVTSLGADGLKLLDSVGGLGGYNCVSKK